MLPSDVECMHPVRHMGYHADIRQTSRNPQTSKPVKEKLSSARADQTIRLQDQLKLEKPISKSYADLHHEVKRTLGDAPLFPRKASGAYQKPILDRKAKDDELVKHMSNLPRYLQRVEKGANIQDKVLNVGVLDWGRLENWKYNQKPVTNKPIICSSSTSTSSSPFSTVGSSTLSTGSDSGVIVPRKKPPSHGADSASSSRDTHSMAMNSTRANVPPGKFLNPNSSSKDPHFTKRTYSKTMLENAMKSEVNSTYIKERASSSSNEVLISPKGKTKVETERPTSNQGRDRTIVLLLPKTSSQNRFSGPSHSAEFPKQPEPGRSSFSGNFFSELYSDIPHSCPQLSQTEPRKVTEMNRRRSVDAHSETFHSLPNSGEMLTVRSDPIQAEKDNKSTSKPTPLTARQTGNQSPNRFPTVGKVTRSLSFKEGSSLPQLSSTYVTAKSGPVESSANPRARSSPLRRLLDPLLRPKTANPIEATSVSRVADNNGAKVASMVQALLQVTVKNGLPWFTFAVDNTSDILAATMRKTSSSEKYDCSWIYTFYTFRKAKKKTGSWIGHGSKANNRDYVPNVVAQMKVNGSRNSKSNKNHNTIREFVLFGVEPKKGEQDLPETISNIELAAMVIKVPTENIQQSKNYTVILPSGVHGLSTSGLPSPLLERWKSGGSCDCGGWDVGCQLRILSNHDQLNHKSFGSTAKFDLFLQGTRSRESIPSFTFATYNKGVHSIDFNASITSLQAFSICISFLHCQNLAKVSNLFQEITLPEPIQMASERKASAQFPPPSPVGRV